MYFDNAPRQCQPDARAFGLRVQFVEQAKHPLMILRIDPHAVILHKEDRHACFVGAPCANGDMRRRLIAHELHRVVDLVLHDFDQARPITVDHRQRVGDLYLHAARYNASPHQLHRFARNRIKRH